MKPWDRYIAPGASQIAGRADWYTVNRIAWMFDWDVRKVRASVKRQGQRARALERLARRIEESYAEHQQDEAGG